MGRARRSHRGRLTFLSVMALATAYCIPVIAGTTTMGDLVVSNSLAQKRVESTNRFYGFLTISSKGDIAMGQFTNGSSTGPSWWTNRSVVNPTDSPSDYAIALLGQLKWLATNACDELEDYLPGGAGDSVWTLVRSFNNASNYCPANVGQLKYVAKPFYDRILAGDYPWTTVTTDDADGAAATIGQAKNIFSFDIRTDDDSDGLPDWWEMHWFTNLNQVATNDFDSDGLNNADEYVHGTCPTNSDTDGDGLADGVETMTGVYVGTTDTGSDPLNADSDEDGIGDGAEVAASTDPNNPDAGKPAVVITEPPVDFTRRWMP